MQDATPWSCYAFDQQPLDYYDHEFRPADWKRPSHPARSRDQRQSHHDHGRDSWDAGIRLRPRYRTRAAFAPHPRSRA